MSGRLNQDAVLQTRGAHRNFFRRGVGQATNPLSIRSNKTLKLQPGFCLGA